MRLTARSVLSWDGLFGIQRQSATIWGSLAFQCWPAHSSCQRTRGVCWSSQEDRQEEGWCQVMTCLGCFFQDNQTSGMSHSLDPSLNSTSCDMWLTCSTDSYVWMRAMFTKCYGIITSFFLSTIKSRFPTMCSHSSCHFCIWMRPAALNPTVLLWFSHTDHLYPHGRGLKLKSLGPQSAECSLGYKLA